MMAARLLSLLFVLNTCSAIAQDTVFLAKHLFNTPVRNVFTASGSVYAKTGDGLYKLNDDKWELLDLNFKRSYVFYDKGFVESDYLPTQFVFDADSVSHLIPQRSITSASRADLGDRLFICAGGSLFEYLINRNYSHHYEGVSIRDIYLEDGYRVISTYSGIFINDTVRVAKPEYSNGYLRKIKEKYFLSADHLFELVPPASFREIPSGVNVFAGYSRKLIEFDNGVFSLNTKSVNRVDSPFTLQPIHQGYEYFDIEVVGNKLVFCTQTGEVFAYDGSKVEQLADLDTRIRDLYLFKNTLFLSSDKGVYTLEALDPKSLKLFADKPNSVMVLIDALRNTWVSTENGLFLLPDRKSEFIPYIRDVEFNRGALTLFNDTVYAGSISGLYAIDCYYVVKKFIPVYYNRIQADRTEQMVRLGTYGALAIAVLIVLLLGYRRFRKQRAEFVLPQKDNSSTLTPAMIAEAIRTHNIMTVEGLADYYHTNTVQLNRRFKTFETTPGKFMKTVKLDLARELLEMQVPIEEVALKVGYSAGFIKNELKQGKSR